MGILPAGGAVVSMRAGSAFFKGPYELPNGYFRASYQLHPNELPRAPCATYYLPTTYQLPPNELPNSSLLTPHELPDSSLLAPYYLALLATSYHRCFCTRA